MTVLRQGSVPKTAGPIIAPPRIQATGGLSPWSACYAFAMGVWRRRVAQLGL
jgi:hypothetical protein